MNIKKNVAAKPLLRLEVTADFGEIQIASREIRSEEIGATGEYIELPLPFMLSQGLGRVEFRIFSYGRAQMEIDKVSVSSREGVWLRSPLTITDTRISGG